MTETLTFERPFAGTSALLQQVEAFAREHVVPHVREMQATTSGAYVDKVLPAMLGEQRLFGLHVGREHGGLEATHTERCQILGILTCYDPGAAAILQASLIPELAVRYFGTDEQCQQWLPQVNQRYSAIAVTEPGAGGTVLEIEATGRRSADHWVLDGVKCHIGNASVAGVFVVVVNTGKPGSRDERSLSAFLVERDRAGVEVEHTPLGGLRGFGADTVRFDGVRVPHTHLLGEVGDGAGVAHMASIVMGRLNFAAIATGLIRRVLTETLTSLAARPRYGSSVAGHRVVRRQIAKIKSRLMTAEAATAYGARLLDSGAEDGCDEYLCNAKYAAVAAARAAVGTAVDLAGAVANHPDNVITRLQADIQATVHPAGPQDVQLHRIEQAAFGTQPVQWSSLYAHRFPTTHNLASQQARRPEMNGQERRGRPVPA